MAASQLSSCSRHGRSQLQRVSHELAQGTRRRFGPAEGGTACHSVGRVPRAHLQRLAILLPDLQQTLEPSAVGVRLSLLGSIERACDAEEVPHDLSGKGPGQGLRGRCPGQAGDLTPPAARGNESVRPGAEFRAMAQGFGRNGLRSADSSGFLIRWS